MERERSETVPQEVDKDGEEEAYGDINTTKDRRKTRVMHSTRLQGR